VSWRLLRWAWRLEAPVHVGMPPSGSLNRCRLYVPARTLWGALTAELARRTGNDFPCYAEVGQAIRGNARLTYLYPAEESGGQWRAWLPRYESGQGLVWQREDDGNSGGLPDRTMRPRLLVTRAGTAIDPVSDAAAEGSLRETECVGQYWRTPTGDVKPVGLVGYLLVREGSLIQEALLEIRELFLGGDTRYGLGRVRRVTLQPTSQVFGIVPEPDGADPWLTTERVLAHASAPEEAAILSGDLEALAWWDEGQLQAGPGGQWYWRPGSVAPGPVRWRIEESGLWRFVVDGEPAEIAEEGIG
jgi:hypothetical protein